ncbi:MAG: enoyl-CoA hydratase/isomerase family protein [Chloroflexi bacterium]|nr:enoyl-CoA hydratase/isomerase family protein [Chloroflexota bacterium]
MADSEPVLYRQDGGIVTITLNRPEKMNNFGGGLFPALGRALEQFRDDDAALVAILTGNGKAFCAGGDLEDMARRSGRPLEEPSADARRRGFFQSRKATRITNIYKPLIGAINGYCFAGGLEVALCCHFLLGAESSEYGVLNRRFSVPLIDGGTYRLPHVVGLSNALYLIQTGRRIDAREAHRMGLIQEIISDARLMDRARELAAILAAVPQAGLRGDTEAVLRGLGRPIEDALATEAMIGSTVLASDDFKRGPSRFASKQYDRVTG